MIIDGHCDTLKECYKRKCSIADRMLNFNIMDACTPMIQMLAVYISPEEAQNGFYITSKVLDKFYEECVYNLCHHPRNLRDDQIKHIQYIKELVGIDYVGIGSDFDGLEEEDILSDIKGVKDIRYLQYALRKKGFTDNEINKVLGENWQRVLKQNL